MEKFINKTDNPLLDYLTEDYKNLPPIEIGEGITGTIPAIPFEGKFLPIPKNLAPGAQYLFGIKSLERQSLSNIAIALGKIMNNMTEILSFIAIYQNPLVVKQGKESSEQSLKLEKLLENVLKQQVEQLETNRKSISHYIDQVLELEKKEYNTLLEHQKTIVNMILELQSEISKQKDLGTEIESLKTQLQKDLNDKTSHLEKRLKEGFSENEKPQKQISEILELSKELNQKL